MNAIAKKPVKKTKKIVEPPQRVILTRNFKGKTEFKYCMLHWGDKPEAAVEVPGISLTDPVSEASYMSPETLNLQDFGCGVIIVGTLVNGPRPNGMKERKLRWTGHDFVYDDTDTYFDAAKWLEAMPDGELTVWD